MARLWSSNMEGIVNMALRTTLRMSTNHVVNARNGRILYEKVILEQLRNTMEVWHVGDLNRKLLKNHSLKIIWNYKCFYIF